MSNILFELLLLDGNETMLIDSKETYEQFIQLVIHVAKAEKNIRYCSNPNCPCHPETYIKKLLEDDKLVCFLNKYTDDIYDKLINYCNSYIPVVAEGIYEDN